MRICLAGLAALSLALVFHPVRAEDARPAEPQSYRMRDFRAPTPANSLRRTGVDHAGSRRIVAQPQGRLY